MVLHFVPVPQYLVFYMVVKELLEGVKKGRKNNVNLKKPWIYAALRQKQASYNVDYVNNIYVGSRY